jgi:hypothetical protein
MGLNSFAAGVGSASVFSLAQPVQLNNGVAAVSKATDAILPFQMGQDMVPDRKGACPPVTVL